MAKINDAEARRSWPLHNHTNLIQVEHGLHSHVSVSRHPFLLVLLRTKTIFKYFFVIIEGPDALTLLPSTEPAYLWKSRMGLCLN